MSSRFLIVGLSPSVVAATFLVYRLADQNEQLVGRYGDLREASRTPMPGYAVPTMRAPTVAGDTVTVGETPGHRQLLFVLNTTCPHCRATLPVWKRIAAEIEASTDDVEVLALSLDPLEATAAYREEHGLPFPVALFPEEKLIRLYKAGSVPLTVLLDSDGRVEYARLGRLDAGSQAVDSVLAAVYANREAPLTAGPLSESVMEADASTPSATGGTP